MATLYIDKNNAVFGNTGGESDPLRSPQQAQALASANDTIIIKKDSGPYPGPLSGFEAGQTYNFNGNELSGCIDLNALVKERDDYVWKKSSDSSKGWYLAVDGRSTEYIKNPNFDRLYSWKVIDGISFELNYEYVKTGFSSYKLTASGDNKYIYDITPELLSLNANYRVTGSFYSFSGSTTSLEMYKVGGGYSTVDLFSITVNEDGWTDFNVVVPELPVDGTYYIRIKLGSSSDVVYFDHINMYRTDVFGSHEPDCWGLSYDRQLGVIDGVWWSKSHNLSGATQAPVGANNWDYGDFDSLGFDTFYAFLDGGVDPTGTGAAILTSNVNYLVSIGSDCTGCKLYNVQLIGAQDTIVIADCDFGIYLSKLAYVDNNGITLNGTSGTYEVHYCEFYDTGHRALYCTGDNFTMNIYNNAMIGPHLMLLNKGKIGIITNFYNNASDRLVAGAIQWDDVPAGNLREDYNQFRIDPNSHHKLRLAHTESVSTWLTTGSNSIPASTDTSTTALSDGTGCGVDPWMVSSDRGLTSAKLSNSSTCINTGCFIPDFNDNGGTAADGGYVYRLPNIGPWQKTGTPSSSHRGLQIGITNYNDLSL